VPTQPAGGEVLVCCSHGTSDPEGRRVVTALVDAVRAARPDVDVREAFVDVQQPEVADVVAAAVDEGASRVVVVPLLLSGGYHVHVDIAKAVELHPVAFATPALGPDPRLVELLVDRLAEAGGRPDDAVVVAAAGSSDTRASEDVRAVADALARRWPGPVTVGFGSSAEPAVGDAVAQARESGARVLVASYLLAPGHFWSVLSRSGADSVTAPLCFVGADGAPRIDSRLVDLVLDRYDAAVSARQP
jgi:sirohydrochlorin ferrochelatase